MFLSLFCSVMGGSPGVQPQPKFILKIIDNFYEKTAEINF